jgi:hypothetical protein
LIYQTTILPYFPCSESANVLEAESGYKLESAVVSAFREAIMQGRWDQAEEAMERLGAPDENDRRVCCCPLASYSHVIPNLSSILTQAAKFLISQQKYLELLEAQELNAALVVLRSELAPLDIDSERLQLLSRCVLIRVIFCFSVIDAYFVVYSCPLVGMRYVEERGGMARVEVLDIGYYYIYSVSV